MALIKIANLTLLLLAGSTDAFAKPRARVARGGASSSKARDAVLLNWLLANSSLSADGSRKLGIRLGRYPGRPGDDLPPTKPKPLAVELAVDVGIVAATLSLFRRAGEVRPRAKRWASGVRSGAEYMDLHQGVYDAQEALTSTLTTTQPHS